MQKTASQLGEIKLVGITARTNNAQVFANPSANKIVETMQKYFQNGLNEKIMARKNPGTTFCVYTDYESDFNGDYTYFIGEEVIAFTGIDEGLETLSIPAQTYAKFTNQPGPMPAVCVDMWTHIIKMRDADFGGRRAYIADFEVYDARSHDPQNTILDIYIGVKGK